jgi:hypothetical protein
MSDRKEPRGDSTLAALLKEKRKRGRPKHSVPRHSVYVALTSRQKKEITTLAKQLPPTFSRADIPDMAITMLSVRLQAVRRAVADRDRELPEGITDMESRFFVWALEPQLDDAEAKWTSVRLSPAQSVEFGRLQGTFNALFGANRSQVFALALALLTQQVRLVDDAAHYESIDEFEAYVVDAFL